MNNTHSPVITIIDPIISTNPAEGQAKQKLRVAAYARVSTEQDEQQNSYAAQMSYYTTLITNNPDWEFAGIYSDEGISGTSMKKRDGFNRMIADAKSGKIDRILVKSISRFSRNTVDALTITRDLRNIGVGVSFEKENVDSMNLQGEMLLTILCSLAQEESHSISENVRWGKQKSMMDGKVTLAYSSFLGYKKGEDGNLEIVPEEAEIVRLIYDLFLKDMTIQNIAKYLTAQGYKTPMGKDRWHTSTVRSILSNEKYKGDALLQKTYIADFLTKKVKKNDGELKQWYINDSHPAIIEPDLFDLVQAKLISSTKNGSKLGNNSPFTTKIVCGDCGGFFGRKIYHSNDKYRTVAWCCNQKYADGHVCTTPRIREDELIQDFFTALRQALAEQAPETAPRALDGPEGDTEADRLRKARDTAKKALDRAVAELRALVQDNTRRSQDQTVFREKHARLSERVEDHKKALATAEETILNHTAEKAKRKWFSEVTSTLSNDMEFSDELVSATLEKLTISPVKDGSYHMEFAFTNGAKITLKKCLKSKKGVV